MLYRGLVMVICSVSLTACANLPNGETVAWNTAQATCSQAFASPTIGSIRNKIPMSGPPSVIQLSDNSIANQQERSEIVALENQLRICWAAEDNYFNQWNPQSMVIHRAARSASDILRARLYSGDITFGQYNRERLNLITTREQQLSELSRLDRAEAARRSEIINAQIQTNLLQQQMRLQQLQQNRGITCQRFGNITTCN